MTNKLVVIINSLKVPKIKKILLYEIKFLVPNYSCLQNPWLGGYRPQIPVLSVLCPQLNLLTSPPEKKIPRYATDTEQYIWNDMNGKDRRLLVCRQRMIRSTVKRGVSRIRAVATSTCTLHSQRIIAHILNIEICENPFSNFRNSTPDRQADVAKLVDEFLQIFVAKP